jgi:multidrug resistance efflux pump
VVRDPLTAVDDARVVSLATDAEVDSVSAWQEDGAATVLGTEATRMSATATLDRAEQTLARVRVRAGEDSVTAIATDPDDTAPPFDAVTRDA